MALGKCANGKESPVVNSNGIRLLDDLGIEIYMVINIPFSKKKYLLISILRYKSFRDYCRFLTKHQKARRQHEGVVIFRNEGNSVFRNLERTTSYIQDTTYYPGNSQFVVKLDNRNDQRNTSKETLTATAQQMVASSEWANTRAGDLCSMFMHSLS
ncbi:hypothetical protein TNCT_416701 [Trichonephila clavata]|uniref:Uncharacterized protein n=1 Tax=Trichonephila clavata TaxID=2740835 RepID=A0A8X6LR21_TRICU|nr:hypothetical protein TNCT_416701 [Trichonephila clavata]